MDCCNHFLFLKFLFLIFNRAIVNGDCEVPRSTSPHVIITLDAADGQNRIKLSCKDGFTAASGDSVITCLDSMWKVIDGNSIRRPIPFICKEKRCPVINPENGLVELRENLVLYSCNRGYRLEGSARAMCRLNRKKQYYINRRVPTCKKRPECKLSVTSPVSYNGSTYDGEIATFSCPENYKLIGSTNLTCNATGNWEGDLPYCELVSTCHDPGMSAYSNRDGSCCDSGMSLTYVCQSGYEYLDANIGGTITCVGNHTWSSPKPICIPIGSAVCPNVPKENNLMIEADYRIHPDVYLPDDVLDLACIENYETNQTILSLNCLDDGIWDYPFPVCYPIISCGRPRIPKNGKILELENNDGDVFPVEFEINLKCDDGYAVRSRLYKTKCVGDKWESVLEDCTRIYCRNPGIPRHGFRNGNSFYVGDVVSFSCRHEYKLIGSSNVICDATGNWEGTLPYCEYTSNCNDPGYSEDSRRIGDCCDAGTSLTYACNDGYKSLDGNIEEKIKCVGNDTWSAPRPICIPIVSAVCPTIPVENNLEIHGIFHSHSDVYLAGDIVHLFCIDNYQSDQKLRTLTCSDNGTWDKRIPTCYPISPCDRPRTPKNGRILELEDNDQNLFPIRFELNIECDEGYVVKSGRYEITCVDDNKWNSELEDCIRISCDDPGIPNHGVRSGNSFYWGDIVSYSCNDNYTLIGSSSRICLKKGLWSGSITVCHDGRSHCVDPGVPVNSYRVGLRFNKGDIVVYSCKNGYTMFGQNGTRQCLNNGSWSGEEIRCYDKMEATTTTASGKPTFSDENSSSVNVFFLLDASTSISKQHFDRAKEFIKFVIRKIGISEEILGVRIGVIAFSTQARVVLDIYEKNLQVAIDLIGSLRFARGGSNIMKALNKLTEVILEDSIKEPERAKSKSIAFLISDGFVTEGGFSVVIVKSIEKQYNVVFQAVATGSKYNLEILMQISSRVLTLTNNHIEILYIVEKFVGRKTDFSACGLDRPDYSVEIEPGESGKRYKRSTSDLARIIGGKRVIRPWPWIVALRLHPISEHRTIMNELHNTVMCSGTIIHSEWILTAAHCFSNDYAKYHKLLSTTQNWRGIAGRTNMHLSSGIEFPVNAIYSHPLYDKSDLDYNIALLKINPIPFNYFIRPICLPPSFADLPKYTYIYKPKQKATIIGWGSTALRFPNDTSRIFAETHLREVEVSIQDDRICHQPLNYTACRRNRCQNFFVTPTDRMICTENDGVDSCQGDSGGPLMQQLTTFGGKYPVRRWVQIGIIDWGIGCGLKEFNSYYTNAAKMRSFIENVTQIEFENIRLRP